ncbi:MAG: EAL domain-containing protein [gamma proteobacterium symbiont of Taylorina sp.]|nr:EAL domain-containing protein [gamma proteobacterium symbiont of Taylorina sp.]
MSLISSFVVYTTFDARLNILREKQDISITLASHNINHILSDHISDLNYFYRLVDESFRNDRLDLNELASNGLKFMQSKPYYDQIRILNHQGKETLRINYNSGKPEIVPQEKLQDKSKRYYFFESIVLNAGELFISPLDLNIERGKIEQPLKPMIRFAIPFNDKNGEKGGVIIFNYLAEELLAKLQLVNTQYKSTLFLLNSDGYFLFNKDQTKEWGFMYKNNIRFQKEQADGWNVITGAEKGRFKVSSNYFSFVKISPLKEYRHYYQYYHWYLVSQLPADIVKALFYQQIRTLSPIVTMVIFILLLITWKLVSLIIKQKNLVNNLEVIVDQRTDELTQSKALLQNVIVGANLGFWEWYYQTGQHSVSDRWLDILGLNSEDVEGVDTDWSERIHKDDRPGVNQVIEQAIKEDIPYRVEFRMRHKDGSWVWIEGSGRVIEREAETGKTIRLCGTHQDISDRIQGELKQKEHYKQLQLLLENINGISWELDLSDNYFSYVSPGAERILGYPLESWVNMDSLAAMIIPEDRESAAKHCYIETVAGRDHNFEYRMQKKSGEVIWVLDIVTVIKDNTGKPIKLAGFILDNTEQKNAMQAIVQNEKRLKLAASVFTHAHEGIVITDIGGKILDVNNAFSRITGYSRDEVLGENPRILKSDRQEPEFYKNLWRKLVDKGYWSGEIWNRNRNAEIYVEHLTISTVQNDNNETQHYIGLFTDITEQKYHQQQLEYIAHFDALTKLPNRLLLADRLHQALSQAQRRKSKVAVAYLDLDEFKGINDNHGHDAGDLLLIRLANSMQKALREGDTIARIGGDEFAVVLIDLSSIDDSIPLLNRLLEAASQVVMIDGINFQISASIGVTFYPQDDEMDSEQLLRQADQAMYQSKLKGKNRYHIFDAEEDLSIRVRQEDLKCISLALAADEFVLYYQPKVNMRSGEVVGVEALIRWQHPRRGLLPPGEFLPIIENHLLSVAMGDWVIDQAISQLDEWHKSGLDIQISINIDALQLQQPDFVSNLFARLDKSPHIKPGMLLLEVLETSALEDILFVSQIIELCRERGIYFSLDDFGTGYSSLTYLKRLPVNELKIDQSFVRDMLDDPENLSILEGILGLGRAFQHKIIAEGIETIEHGEMLLNLGSELAQGYAISHPLPAAELQLWVTSWQPDSIWSNSRTFSRGDIPLLFAGTEHRAWVKKIEEWFRGDRNIPPTMDQFQCRFGQWLNHKGLEKYGEQSAFQSIVTLHQEVHSIASQLQQLKSKGSVDEAEVMLSELQFIRDKLLEYLKQLIR